MDQLKNFALTKYDTSGLGSPEEYADWYVVPTPRTRGSDCIEESNFAAACQMLSGVDPTEADHTTIVLRHWAVGWIEIIIVRPDSHALHTALLIESKLEVYPILDEYDVIERETSQADYIWNKATTAWRIAFIREHRSSFEFISFSDMLACARGHFFCGDRNELLY